MSERFSPRPNLEKERIAASTRIGQKALNFIDKTYGSGYPSWSRGTCELSYHNGHHGRAVGQGAAKLCVSLGLGSVEQSLAQTSGFAHDLIQLKGRGIDEQESADWLEERLAETELFPPELRRMGALAIIGTEPLFDKSGNIAGQKATELSYATKEAEQLAKSVACGDFGELYTPQGPYLGHQYFRELQGMKSAKNLPFEKMIAHQKYQINLMETYKYPLPVANKLLATHRPQTIAYSKKVLKDLEEGTIDSWDELERRDLQFIKQNR